MGIEDEFMEIVNNNNLQDFMFQSESQHMTIKDLHLGMRDISEAMLYITDFIHNFFSSISENSEEERPNLSVDSVMYAKMMFENASKFCDSIVDSTLDDEDDYEDEEDKDN
jgi:hypothetical protein